MYINNKSTKSNKKVAVIQSSYIPWKGYFDIINSVDEFIIQDDVQYTRRDWRNRNKIKGPKGSRWLTIPVEKSGKYLQQVKDAKVASRDWGRAHWTVIQQHYGKARHFKAFKEIFESLYLETPERYLSEINFKFINAINGILGITTPISFSRSSGAENSSRKLLELCKDAHAGEYVSGPSAKAYLDTDIFEKEGISVSFVDYTGYPEYDQVYPPFEHQVSVLDLIFCAGAAAPQYMKSFDHADTHTVLN